jgi:hypothetical protein
MKVITETGFERHLMKVITETGFERHLMKVITETGFERHLMKVQVCSKPVSVITFIRYAQSQFL